MIHKWDHYLDIYEKYFSKYRGRQLNVLEIGIFQGGSIQLWEKYFGRGLSMFSIDINPDCKKFESPTTKVFIGSQSDKNFLRLVAQQLPELDIIIDDGGHTMQQQLVSFHELFPKLKQGGVYLVEDTHTSYFEPYFGGLRKQGTFIEEAKALVDSLYNFHLKDKEKIRRDEITKDISCISFYDSIVAFEKLLRPKPFNTTVGKATISMPKDEELKKESITKQIRKKIFGHNRSTLEANSQKPFE